MEKQEVETQNQETQEQESLEELSLVENLIAKLITTIIILAIAYLPFGFVLSIVINNTDTISVYEITEEGGELDRQLTKYFPGGAASSVLAFLGDFYIDTLNEPEFVTRSGKTINLNNYQVDDRIVVNAAGQDLHVKITTYGDFSLREDVPRTDLVKVGEYKVVEGYTGDLFGCDDKFPDSSSDDYLYWTGTVPYSDCR